MTQSRDPIIDMLNLTLSITLHGNKEASFQICKEFIKKIFKSMNYFLMNKNEGIHKMFEECMCVKECI